MFLFLVTAFIVLPVLEIFILIQLGKYFGLWSTVLIVLGTGIVGAYLARMQGFMVLRQIRSELAERRVPGGAMLDGLFILAGGIMLITPGVVSDILGLLFLFPLTRKLCKGLVVVWLRKWFAEGKIIIWRGYE